MYKTSSRAVVLEVWFPHQQLQHYLGIWEHVRNAHLGGPALYLLNQKLWNWGPAICILTSQVIPLHAEV